MMEFVVSTEQVNKYGYRVLTSGIDVKEFRKNPIMLYNHHRSRGYGDKASKEVLPPGKWENIRKEDGKLIATPVFDENDEFGKKLKGKVEGKFINTTSIHFRIIDVSTDPKHMLPGQTRATVTKSELQEISFTDIPGNAGCVRLSYQGQTLSLSSETTEAELNSILPLVGTELKQNVSMKNIATLLKLKENASESDVIVKLTEMQNRLTFLEGENDKLKKEQEEGRNQGLIEDAIREGKLTDGQKETWLKLAASDYEGTKLALEGMSSYKAPTKQIRELKKGEGETSNSDYEEYRKLEREGKLSQLRKKEPEKFERLYNAFKLHMKSSGAVR